MSLSRSTNLPMRAIRSTRLMHGAGRTIPNPGQGGAAPQTTISPSTSAPSPSQSQSLGSPLASSSIDPSASASIIQSRFPSGHSPEARYTPKGKLIPSRPPRGIPVTLPSGHTEPTSYPPSAEYLAEAASTTPSPHPLWQFFHPDPEVIKGPSASWTAPPNLGSLEPLTVADANLLSGRAWTAAELRQKSFADLHTLWYVLLRERNVLATQREERRRLEIGGREGGELVTNRAFRCRKSMARIKYVLNERRLGLIAAATPLPTEQQAEYDFLTLDPSEEADAIAADEEVAREEVESRDEGFGGGEEAKQFVEDVKVVNGEVVQKA